MSEIVERGAVRLFWRAEHLDPNGDGDVPESEWFGEEFPAALSERKREFWRLLMKEAIAAMREPTDEQLKAAHTAIAFEESLLGSWHDWAAGNAKRWKAMLDAALSDKPVCER